MEQRGEYIEFLEQVADELEQPASGIARAAVTAGALNGLSEKQHTALSIGVSKWLSNNFTGYRSKFLVSGEDPEPPGCSECPEAIPWCEVHAAAKLFDGRCSWCEQLHHKPGDE